MIDDIATMSPEQYTRVRSQLEAEGLWDTGEDYYRECRSNERAVEIIERDNAESIWPALCGMEFDVTKAWEAYKQECWDEGTQESISEDDFQLWLAHGGYGC